MRHIVRTFSRHFPSYHPRAGEPTYFVEKILLSIPNHLGYEMPLSVNMWDNFEPKHHTIRAGHHFQPGDFLVPRVWSGKPYKTKQIQIAPPIEIVKTWDFELSLFGIHNECLVCVDGQPVKENLIPILAKNDGLTVEDFANWFQVEKDKPFLGQIICWNKDVEYTISKPIALTSI